MSKLKRTAIIITLLSLVLKFSGFLRESVMAWQFGATHYTDGYLISFSFITLVVAMISGGFNNVFLPLYVKNRKERPEETEKNAVGVMNQTVVWFFGATVILYFFVPYFLPLMFPDMDNVTEKTAVDVTQFFFLFLSAIALNGILESYLQARRIFVPAQISRLLATLTGAVFAILFSDQMGINSLAYGFITGTILGGLLQYFYLAKSGFRWQPTLQIEPEFKKTLLVLLLPSFLNTVVGQINMFINKIFATGTEEGAVTYLNNASLLVSIPNTIYATTIATIIFTLLAEQIGDRKKFQNTVFMGLELSFISLVPIAVGLYIVGMPALSFIYERGQFTPQDTANTYLALVNYLPLMVVQGLHYIVAKSMYALDKTKIIMRISISTVVLNIIMNMLLVDRFGYPGLALTSSIVSFYFLSFSFIALYKDFPKEETRRVLMMCMRVIIPSIFMALPLLAIQYFTDIESLYSLWQLAILVPIGIVFYIIGSYLFNRAGFYRVIRIVKKK
ncbi:murein biosynthesis integral membrane protein MurJ [Fictibacillus aquaticus]|uniref:Murein biosynthesis protein MurJ n=1 Tax=Fictibacillus aquaticus TaxID=2021314 RepID=A0A235FF38_9BACL|nr:lipid II flippase MurJ [Fictibacillus aquaticus]OYD59769.1 murein biosynthesis protein MurJ [Fictibacillus aquaticus]